MSKNQEHIDTFDPTPIYNEAGKIDIPKSIAHGANVGRPDEWISDWRRIEAIAGRQSVNNWIEAPKDEREYSNRIQDPTRAHELALIDKPYEDEIGNIAVTGMLGSDFGLFTRGDGIMSLLSRGPSPRMLHPIQSTKNEKRVEALLKARNVARKNSGLDTQ